MSDSQESPDDKIEDIQDSTPDEDIDVDFEDDEPYEEDVRMPGEPSEAEKNEIIERMMMGLSEECRVEVQNAVSGLSEISPDCQAQVQRVISQANGYSTPPQNNVPPRELGPDPTMYIVTAFVAIFIAVAFKVYSISNELKKLPEKPKKKLSKRKLMKMKAKEQRANQN